MMSQPATSTEDIHIPHPSVVLTRAGRARLGLVPATIALLLGINLLVASALCWSAIGQTWGGFSFNYYYLITRTNDEQPIPAGSAGDQSGVQRGDTLLQVNGQSASNFAAAVARRNQATYLIERNGQLLTFSGPLTSFNLLDFLGFYGLSLAVGWVMFALGVGVYLLRPSDPTGQQYMLTFTLAGGVIVLNNVGLYVEGVRWLDQFWFEPLYAVLLSFLGAASFQFATIFPARKPIRIRYPRLPLLGYLLAVALSLIYVLATFQRISDVASGQVFNSNQPFQLFAYVFTSLGLLAVIAGLVWDWQHGDERVRRQARIVLGGAVVGLSPIVLLTLVPAMLIGQPIVTVRVSVVMLLAFPLAIAYAIIRHRLFDLNFYLRRAITYVAASAIVALIYFVLVTLIHALFVNLTGETDSLVLVFSAIAIAIIFNPIRQRLQAVVEGFFFRERFIFRQAMLDFSRRVREARTIEELADLLVQEVTTLIDLRDAAVYASSRSESDEANLRLAARADHQLRISTQLPRFRGTAEQLEPQPQLWPPALQLDAETRRWLIANPVTVLLEAPPAAFPPEGEGLLNLLRDSGVLMFAPLTVEERLVGLLLMSAKRSGVGMLREDSEVLTALLPQVALAMSNAQFAGIQNVLDETRLLYETSRRIGAALTSDEIIAAYLEQVAARGQYSCNVVLYKFDAAGERTGVLVKGLWRPDIGLVQVEEHIPYTRDALDDPLDGGETVTISDVEMDPRVPDNLREMQRQAHYPALAFIPLMVRGERIGLVILSYPEPHHWLEAALQPYQVTAAQLATALDRQHQQLLLAEQGQQLAVLEERQRLARELHDSVTQLIFSITLIAQSLSPAWRRDQAEGEQRISRLLELSRTALTEMRALLAELRPSIPAIESPDRLVPGIVQVRRDGLPSALQHHIGSVTTEGLHIEFNSSNYARQPLEHEEALYRITQEALNNIIKHAGAQHVTVSLCADASGTHLTVSDDGVGFILPAGSQGSGLGMSTMRERAAALGGSTAISSLPGKGTTIEVHLPRKELRP